MLKQTVMKRNHLTILMCLLPIFLVAQSGEAVLGIQSRHISKHMAKKRNLDQPYGSYILKVHKNSAAEELGLRLFDYVFQIDEKKVADTLSISHILRDYSPGDVVNVKYVRQGVIRSGQATLTDDDDVERIHRGSEKDPFLGVQTYHGNDKKPKGQKGIMVNPVANSTAWAMGLQNGDLITAIDDTPFYSWDEMGALIDDREVGDYIKVTIYRDGEIMNFNRPIKSRAATHNDHSRGNTLDPEVIEAIEPSADNSEVVIEKVEEQEAQVIEKTLESELPLIRDLEVQQLNVFPNPTTGIFDINLTVLQEGRTTVRVLTPQGQVIYENNLGNFSGTFSDRIDIANNAKGIYFLIINQDQRRITRKIVLQ